MSVKSVVFSAALALSVLASGAQAGTITFETAPNPDFFLLGPVVEDGFQYSGSDAIFIGSNGNPGLNAEAYPDFGGGVLDIVAEDGSLFSFTSLDYAAYDSSGEGSQTLMVSGYLNDVLLLSDFFELDNTSINDPAYGNWQTMYASALVGLQIDRLSISLNGGVDESTFYQAVDNINLTSAVPEPATWAMMITGFGLAGAMLRRRRGQGLTAA